MIDQSGISTWLGIASAVLGLFAAGCSSSSRTTLPPAADNLDVVAVYGNDVLTLDEFERRYAQGAGSRESAREDTLSDYRDFLERYVNFRLKVAAAEAAGLHTQPDVQDEIRSYRSQLARPYLLEQEVLEPIIREIYDRQQQLVDVSHILIRVPEDASPEDTLTAYRKLQAVRDSALQDVDFGELALRHSEDPSAGSNQSARGYKGRLGYFTGGNLVEPFESFAYETPVGAVTPVFRTQFGYHILKVHDRRPAVPDIRVSHIMLRAGSTPSDSARALMELLRNQIQSGADFAALAEEHSQDMQSGPRGGDLGMVNFTAPLPESFKEAAFSLEDIGDVSGVVETSFGLHLIQLTDREAAPSYDESYEELKTLANRLPRTRRAEKALALDIIKSRAGRVDTARVISLFDSIAPDSVVSVLSGNRLPDEALSDTFFVLGDTSFTVRDLAGSAGGTGSASASDTETLVREIVSSFVTDAAIDVEAARLEDRDPEFRRLMDEFRDGLVLFELMEDSVWSAAEQDSAALRAHYEAHADSYRWPNRTRVIGLNSPSDSLLEAAARRLDDGEPVRSIHETYVDDSLQTLRVDTTMIADSTHSIYDQALDLAAGDRTDVLPYRGSYIVLINDGIEPARGKTFEEARAQVVSEYQQIVEERLIERLRRKYNAHTFPDRLQNAYREDEPGAAVSGAATHE